MTPEAIARNAHISDAEVLRDIADTEREIATMEQEREGLLLMPDRWSHMKAEARLSGIAERRAFIAKLRELLAARGTASPQGSEK